MEPMHHPAIPLARMARDFLRDADFGIIIFKDSLSAGNE